MKGLLLALTMLLAAGSAGADDALLKNCSAAAELGLTFEKALDSGMTAAQLIEYIESSFEAESNQKMAKATLKFAMQNMGLSEKYFRAKFLRECTSGA